MGKRASKASIKTTLEQANNAWSRGHLASAFSKFLEAAKLGEKEAFRIVAQFYSLGEGTKRDEEQALHWYLRAHREGHDICAANSIGCILRDRGEIQRALWWFWRAIRQGELESHINIAKIHLKRGELSKASRHLRLLVSTDHEVVGIVREEARTLLYRMGDRSMKPTSESKRLGRVRTRKRPARKW